MSAKTSGLFVASDERWESQLRPQLLDNVTTLRPDQIEPISERLWSAFSDANNEVFEDGIESNFSKKILQLMDEDWPETLDSLVSIIDQSRFADDIVSEALRLLGRIDHISSYYKRLWLLRHSLFNSAAELRDAASLGLATVDDPDAIDDLQKAIAREPIVELRRDMRQVLDQLQNTLASSKTS